MRCLLPVREVDVPLQRTDYRPTDVHGRVIKEIIA